MRYEYMKPDDYHRVRDAAPIAYIPWGAHEWHGKHNPLGLDTLKVHGQCQALCAETGGIVFPPVYCGTQTMKPYAGFDCTLEFSVECVKLMAKEYLDQLAEEGFKVIVIMMGHYGPIQQATIREAVSEFNARQDSAVAWAFPDYEPTREEGYPGDHAGRQETSYMLLFHPELVDLSRLPDRELTKEEDGIMGPTPREASAKLGREGVNVLVRNAAVKIRELLAAKSGSHG